MKNEERGQEMTLENIFDLIPCRKCSGKADVRCEYFKKCGEYREWSKAALRIVFDTIRKYTT